MICLEIRAAKCYNTSNETSALTDKVWLLWIQQSIKGISVSDDGLQTSRRIKCAELRMQGA